MGKSAMDSFYDGLKKLNTYCATLSGILLLFVTFSIVIDVFLRYLFNRPTIWITEVSTYLFLYIIFLGTSYALQQGMHIRVTFLMGPLSPKAVRVATIITTIFSIIFVCVLLWQTSIMTWVAYKGRWTTPTVLNTPYIYFHSIMVIGSFLLLITFVCILINQVRGDRPEAGRA